MKYDIGALCNGILGGLVSITGACDAVQPSGAFAIGFIGGLVYCSSAYMCVKLRVDDPIEASAVHGFCGIWGLIAVGLFHKEKGVLFGTAETNTRLSFLLVQCLGMISIVAWVATMCLVFFNVVNYMG